MINGKRGALTLLGLLSWIAVCSAADNGAPIFFGVDKAGGADRVTDGVLWDAPAATQRNAITGDWGTGTRHLHACSWSDGNDDGCEPCESPWSATGDIMILRRSPSKSQQLLYDSLNQTSLLNASDMEFPIIAGVRVGVIGHCMWGYDVEANFFGIQGWSATNDFPSASLPAGFALLSVDQVFQGPAGVPITDVHFTEHSNLYSGEINVRRPVSNWVTLLAGFRWMELDESYESRGVRTDASQFTHTIRAFNHMYGFQVGADISLFNRSNGPFQFGQTMVVGGQTCGFRINGILKAGIFGNSANQNTAFSNPGSLGDFAAYAEGNHAAFMGEAGIVATYQFSKHFALRGGYQFLYIDSVALAAAQMSSTDLFVSQTATIDTSGSILCHGANAGLEFAW
jgi:hypothetical protein